MLMWNGCSVHDDDALKESQNKIEKIYKKILHGNFSNVLSQNVIYKRRGRWLSFYLFYMYRIFMYGI